MNFQIIFWIQLNRMAGKIQCEQWIQQRNFIKGKQLSKNVVAEK